MFFVEDRGVYSSTGAVRQYSWHATHKNIGGFARVLLLVVLFLPILIVLVIGLISFSDCNSPGARSLIYVLLDAF